MTVHVCFDQEPTLQVWSVGKPLPVRYFAIGPITHVFLRRFHLPVDDHTDEVLGE